MKVTICVLLASACLALTYAFPAEEIAAPDQFAPSHDELLVGAELDAESLNRDKRNPHRGGYGGGYGGYGGGYGKFICFINLIFSSDA